MSQITTKISDKISIEIDGPIDRLDEHGTERYVYDVKVLWRGNKIVFKYVGSYNDRIMGRAPTREDILYTMMCDYYVSGFAEFCIETDQSEDSRKAYKEWKHCVKHSKKLQKVFSESEISQLSQELD